MQLTGLGCELTARHRDQIALLEEPVEDRLLKPACFLHGIGILALPAEERPKSGRTGSSRGLEDSS